MAIVERATELSQQGVPISVAHKMADSALNLNPQLWNFLIGAINFAYKDSKSTEAAIADGRMQKICVDALMGRWLSNSNQLHRSPQDRRIGM